MTLCRAKKRRRPSAFCNDIWREKDPPVAPELECIEAPVELPSDGEPQELEGDYPVSYFPGEQSWTMEDHPQLQNEHLEIAPPEMDLQEQGRREGPIEEPETGRRAQACALPKLRITQPSPPGSRRRTTSRRNNLASRTLPPPSTPISSPRGYPWSPEDIAEASNTGDCDLSTTAASPRSVRNAPCPLFACLCWREHSPNAFNTSRLVADTPQAPALTSPKPDTYWLSEKQVCDTTPSSTGQGREFLEAGKWQRMRTVPVRTGLMHLTKFSQNARMSRCQTCRQARNRLSHRSRARHRHNTDSGAGSEADAQMHHQGRAMAPNRANGEKYCNSLCEKTTGG